jgi:hypothetical protein
MLDPDIDALIVSLFPLRRPSDITWAIASLWVNPAQSVFAFRRVRRRALSNLREHIVVKSFNFVPLFPQLNTGATISPIGRMLLVITSGFNIIMSSAQIVG